MKNSIVGSFIVLYIIAGCFNVVPKRAVSAFKNPEYCYSENTVDQASGRLRYDGFYKTLDF